MIIYIGHFNMYIVQHKTGSKEKYFTFLLLNIIPSNDIKLKRYYFVSLLCPDFKSHTQFKRSLNPCFNGQVI